MTEEVLVRMLTAECPQPHSPPTVSVPGPRMLDEDALIEGIWRMYVYLTGYDCPNPGLEWLLQLQLGIWLQLDFPSQQPWMPYDALVYRLVNLATYEGVDPGDAEEVQGALATLGTQGVPCGRRQRP